MTGYALEQYDGLRKQDYTLAVEVPSRCFLDANYQVRNWMWWALALWEPK